MSKQIITLVSKRTECEAVHWRTGVKAPRVCYTEEEVCTGLGISDYDDDVKGNYLSEAKQILRQTGVVVLGAIRPTSINDGDWIIYNGAGFPFVHSDDYVTRMYDILVKF